MKGAAATKVNARLRQELTESREARVRLERRLADAEARTAELEAWKRVAEQEGHPAIVAERLRADEAVARAAAAVAETNARWKALVTTLRPWVIECSGENAPRTLAELEALAEMFGGEAAMPEGSRKLHRTFGSRSQTARLRSGAEKIGLARVAAWSESEATINGVVVGGVGQRRGLAAVEAARQRRLTDGGEDQ